MTTKFLRRTAVALSLSAFAISGVANADQPYSSPSRWNNFRPALDEALAAEDAVSAASNAASSVENLPAPKTQPQATIAPGASHSMGNGSPHYSGGYQPGPSSYSDQGSYSTMPTPAAPLPQASYPSHQSYPSQQSYPAAPVTGMPAAGIPMATGSNCQSCQGGANASPYAQAMSSSWEGASAYGSGMGGGYDMSGYGAACGEARPSLFPYFGGGNLLFMSMKENSSRQIATGVGNGFTTTLVDPDTTLGFETSIGRYFGCGKYGFGVSYMLWNPGNENVLRSGTAGSPETGGGLNDAVSGSIRATMPQYRDVFLNINGTPTSVYNLINGNGGNTTDVGGGLGQEGGSYGAERVEINRNLKFQGMEANFYQFGLMGAQRAAYAGGGHRHGMGMGLGLGGAAGPLVRSSSGRLRMSTSHGFRWMKIEDDLNVCYDLLLTAAGGGNLKLIDDIQIENNLYGYQFGGNLTYCLGSRLDLNVAGKFGIYGNRAELRHRLGREGQTAYLPASSTDAISTTSTDTVLSTLGELDLGLGFRVTNGWTLRGGYRLMGITGVANATDAFPDAYATVAGSGQIHADDSYLLHGGYFGAQFNW